jgi:hypothetical protein
MAGRTLHIVDGDCTSGSLKMAGLDREGQILSWKDALYCGPVPSHLTLRELSRLRSRYWTAGRRASEFKKRDAALATHSQFENVVLWFEPKCALCQLSSAQILSWFHEEGDEPDRLRWVRLHGGELSPQQIPKAYASRKTVSRAQIGLADRLWRAFRQDSPHGLVRLLRTSTSVSSGFRSTIRWLLREYPNRRNGLSRLETDLLRNIHRQGSAPASSAVASIISRETVGDLMLFDMLRNFLDAEHPLLEVTESLDTCATDDQFRRAVLKLTNIGKRVLAGQADAVALNGIDRWIGGVHLKGKDIRWRWDDPSKSIVAVKTLRSQSSAKARLHRVRST